MKEKKSNKETKAMTKKKEKKATPSKFIEIIKKKWLVDTSKTFLLMAIIVAIFIGINVLMQNWNPTPIDFSQEKLYTITYSKNSGEFVLEEYQKIKICRLTQDEEQISE